MNGGYIVENFRYVKPATIPEALSLKKEFGSKARFLLGGTDLLIQMDKGFIVPEVVIDLKGIDALKGIEKRDGFVYVGARVTWTELIESALVKKEFPALWEASDIVASVGVRNTGTLVGNICNAVPSMEGGSPLLAYESFVIIEGAQGKREIPAADFFTGVKKTALTDDEMVTGVKIPVKDGAFGEVYVKMGRYEGENLAQAGVAVVVDNRNNYSIALNAVAPTPVRAKQAEEFLKGKKLDDSLAEKAAELALESISPISDIRASREYRLHMCRVMVKRALKASVSRMETGQPALNTRLI